MLFSCGQTAEDNSVSEEGLMTEYAENFSMISSQNGRKSYHFDTPLLEGYTLNREPYREFRKGIRITTYRNDSLAEVDAVLTADYAIHYEDRNLWEARGNVEVRKSDGTELYTQQLFWNVKTERVYSNVDTKIVQPGNRGVGIGEGFESDDKLKDWRFRRSKVEMEVEMKPRGRRDSSALSRPAGRDSVSEAGNRAAVRPSPAPEAAAGAKSVVARRRPAVDSVAVKSAGPRPAAAGVQPGAVREISGPAPAPRHSEPFTEKSR